MTAGQDSREVYLPAHDWRDFWTGERCAQGRHTVATDRVPVFVKEDCLFPLAKPVQRISGDTVFELTLRIYGRGGSFILAEENDGEGILYTIFPEDPQVKSKRYRIAANKFPRRRAAGY